MKYKIGYFNQFKNQKDSVIVDESDYKEFLEKYKNKNSTDQIMIPTAKVSATRNSIFFQEIYPVDPDFEKKEPVKIRETRFEECIKRGFTPEEKKEWKKTVSGTLVRYPRFPPITETGKIGIFKSVFNLPKNSKIKNEILNLGEEDFDYVAWKNYLKT